MPLTAACTEAAGDHKGHLWLPGQGLLSLCCVLSKAPPASRPTRSAGKAGPLLSHLSGCPDPDFTSRLAERKDADQRSLETPI